MLNNKGERELAYVVKVTDVINIPEAEKVELVKVNEWTCMVQKGAFKPGDLAVYFEIDSKLPQKPEFEFTAKYDYRIKTQKYFKGTVISQGLVMHPDDLHLINIKEGDFLTKELGVTYYEPEDNIRKESSSKAQKKTTLETKMKNWSHKHPRAAKSKLLYKLVKLFYSLTYKKKVSLAWPSWVVKTDEERCQNMPQLFREPLNSIEWIATEKIDGTSTTFTMKADKPKKRKLITCSRNLVIDPNTSSTSSVYAEMRDKYQMDKVLSHILSQHNTFDYITIQGEAFGGSIQKRNYGPEHRLAIFNIIYAESGKPPKRLNPIEMKKFVDDLNKWLKEEVPGSVPLMTVPIVEESYKLPSTCNELLQYAHGQSQIDKGLREGVVFRSTDGVYSFKAVDNEFILKYHN